MEKYEREFEKFKQTWFPLFKDLSPRGEEREKLFEEMIHEYRKLNYDILGSDEILGSSRAEIIRFGNDQITKWEDSEYMTSKAYAPYDKFNMIEEINTIATIDGDEFNEPVNNSCKGFFLKPNKVKKYPNVKKTLESNTHRKWEIEDQIGDKSTVGTVYIGCSVDDEKDCSYIIKVMDVNKGSPNVTNLPYPMEMSQLHKLTMDRILSEVELQIIASMHELAPAIHDIFYCKSRMRDPFTDKSIKVPLSENIKSQMTGTKFKYNSLPYDTALVCKNDMCDVINRRVYIVMDKMDITPSTFLKNINSYTHTLIKYMTETLKKLHKIGIIHGDAHTSNFMFNFTPKGRKKFVEYTESKNDIAREKIISDDKNGDFYGSFKTMKLIDFGKSITTSDIDKATLNILFKKDIEYIVDS